MENDSTDLATAWAAVARSLCGEHTYDDTLNAVVETAKTVVPGSFRVCLSIVDKKGTVQTVAATDLLAANLDRLQHELGEGPSVEALRQLAMVEVPTARHDQRWPAYMSRAAPAGLRSQLALAFPLDTATAAVLSMYSTRDEEIDAAAPGVAEVVATYSEMALTRMREIETLNEALESRKVIGMAIGILMERYGLEEKPAFDFLVRISTTTNIKVRDLAATVAHGRSPSDDLDDELRVRRNSPERPTPQRRTH